ncbi:hypothetical protein [Streptomyces sennicomposti]
MALTQDQRSLFTAIAAPWLDRGEWPIWASIQHYFDQRDQDADAIFHSLPRVRSEVPFAAGYGFTNPMRAPISPRDRVRLTVAASLVLPEVRMAAGEPFVRALRHMIDLYTSTPILNDDVPTIILRSRELVDALPNLKPWFVKVLPDLLSYEPGISTGGVHLGDGSWEREVTRSVWQFRHVHTVEDYIEKTCEIVAKNAAQYAPVAAVEEEAALVIAEPERAPYIDLDLLDDLDQAAQKTSWKVHKLIALCRELNDNYVAGNPYACAALIRAILDHIPPVFGHQDFKQVAAQHVFAVKRTDKAHAQRLAAFKDIADDVMHRPVSATVPVISMSDLPEPARLNAVLQELLSILQ